MKIVLDTNVFVSGIFFSGPPPQNLRAWRVGSIRIAYSPEIMLEYKRVLAEFSQQFPGVRDGPFLGLLRRYGDLVRPERVAGLLCRDPEGLKFLECLLYSKAQCLISGDKDLLAARSNTVVVLTPRQFCDRCL
jgi:putative PIN family toxin of toxin-antitoxin system